MPRYRAKIADTDADAPNTLAIDYPLLRGIVDNFAEQVPVDEAVIGGGPPPLGWVTGVWLEDSLGLVARSKQESEIDYPVELWVLIEAQEPWPSHLLRPYAIIDPGERKLISCGASTNPAFNAVAPELLIEGQTPWRTEPASMTVPDDPDAVVDLGLLDRARRALEWVEDEPPGLVANGSHTTLLLVGEYHEDRISNLVAMLKGTYSIADPWTYAAENSAHLITVSCNACGDSRDYDLPDEIPRMDVPCKCGNVWLIKHTQEVAPGMRSANVISHPRR